MKTTKEIKAQIREATKLISARYVDPDFAKDATLKYMAALNPENVTALIDDYEAMKAALERIERDVGCGETAWIGPDESASEYCAEVLASLRLGKEGGEK